MKLEVNISKKRFFVILGAMLLLAGVVITYAFSDGGLAGTFSKTKEQAVTFGHSSDEVVVDIGGVKYTLQDAIEQGKIGGGSGGGTGLCSNTPIISSMENDRVYQNTGSKPLIVVAWMNSQGGNNLHRTSLNGYVSSDTTFSPFVDNPDSELVASEAGPARKSITFVVPVGYYYKVSVEDTTTGDTIILTSRAWEMCGGSGGTPHGKQRFTSNGKFTVPAGVTTVWVSMSGGGGGGASGGAGSAPGGGAGGGGEAVIADTLTVISGADYVITVGAGSAPGGGAGGSSSFGVLRTVAGGAFIPNTGGCNGADGGDSIFGFGGAGGAGGGAAALPGGAGGGFGGGGGGSGGCYNNIPADGGSGAPGFVLVEW